MKKINLLLLFIVLNSININAQVSNHLPLEKLIELITIYPEGNQDKIIEGLKKTYQLKNCQESEVVDNKIIIQYELCKKLINGIETDNLRFVASETKGNEFKVNLLYQFYDPTDSTLKSFEVILDSIYNFSKIYEDKESKKFSGTYNGRRIVINTYHWSNTYKITFNFNN